MTTYAYWPFYCEENVWHLCADEALPPGPREVWMVINETGAITLWEQRAGGEPDGLVIWDYHVVLVSRAEVPRVWDLDSRLPLGTPAREYLDRTFRPTLPDFAPKFRVIDAHTYRQILCSDRSHMLDPQGQYVHPPPPWTPPGGPERGSNLLRLCDPQDDEVVGTVVDLPELMASVTGRARPG